MADASALTMARRVAAHGLPGSGDADPPVVSDQVWPILLRVLADQHLTGLALAAFDGGRLSLTKDQTQHLLRLHREAMVWDLQLERKLLELAGAFATAGIDLLVLKGSALAHGFYPDPSWRSFGDLDLLVLTEDWRTACELLEASGFHRDLPEPRPGFDERFGKAAAHTDEHGFQVDLHRTLVLGAFGLWMCPDELFGRTTTFVLGGRSLRRLDDTATLLHACLHASLGAWPPLLLPLRDVAQVARCGEIDWSSLGDIAERWRLGAVLGHALGSVERTLGLDLPDQAERVMSTPPNARERRILEAYTTRRRGRGGTALTVIRCIPGIRARASYVRAMLVPDREFLAARGRSGASSPSYLRRWMVPVRWLTGRRYRG